VVTTNDSFTYNLVHLLEELGAEVLVHRSDELTPGTARAHAPDRVVISPGPGRPDAAGCSIEVIRELGQVTPTLGVCLGHQAIVEAHGGETGPARTLLHGKASRVRHDGRGVFEGLPPVLDAGRYHSLASTRIPDALEITALTDDGEVMGVRHRTHPVEGVQFHPESVLTPEGRRMLANFLFRSPDSALRRLRA
jgi:anthranilate synthase/aminodeoxychorismate synthase-like glutamine amidotransferase